MAFSFFSCLSIPNTRTYELYQKDGYICINIQAVPDPEYDSIHSLYIECFVHHSGNKYLEEFSLDELLDKTGLNEQERLQLLWDSLGNRTHLRLIKIECLDDLYPKGWSLRMHGSILPHEEGQYDEDFLTNTYPQNSPPFENDIHLSFIETDKGIELIIDNQSDQSFSFIKDEVFYSGATFLKTSKHDAAYYNLVNPLGHVLRVYPEDSKIDVGPGNKEQLVFFSKEILLK
ncbi:hypothetical protein LNTAR_15027, partial [Lentisphaera araneosa HTCC2155]